MLRFAAIAMASLGILGLPAVSYGEGLPLTVMTFNIKYGSMGGDNSWDVRRPILARCIARQDPDLVGTQEALFFQVKNIAEDLPGYDWVALGRAGGSKDEMMAIFYKRDRFEVMAFDHFWLSDTPEVIGSRTWGHENRRMVTWVRFKEKASGAEFYHWNTHFDHRVQAAREKSAALVLERIRAVEPKAPVILTGDFNAGPENAAYATLTSARAGALNLRDSWVLAEERKGEGIGSFNRWRGPQEGAPRIDWILVSPKVSCTRIAIDTYEEGGQYPSDHFPVVAQLIVDVP